MPDQARTVSPVETPCIGVCTLGPHSLCIGCLRTSQEIGDWLAYSEGKRRRIIEQLPGRLETLFSI